MKSKINKIIKVAFVMAMLPLSQNISKAVTKIPVGDQTFEKEKLDFSEAKKVVPKSNAVGTPRVQTKFNMRNYFENLVDFSAINSGSSCGYVSLTQALSYYDTFYNDHIIPEKYDRNYTTATTEAEVKLHSPGILSQEYEPSEYDYSYYNFIHATADTDLQSRLTLEQNIIKGTDNPTDFIPGIGAWDYSPILDKVIFEDSDTSDDFELIDSSVGETDVQQEDAKDYIRQLIDQNTPVIVHIQIRDTISGQVSQQHSVVAYDYDANNIYANFGWGANYTHKPVNSYSYNQIYWMATLDFKWTSHQHSNNYIINGNTYSGCNHNEYLINSNDYSHTVSPRFVWGGMEDYLFGRQITDYYFNFYDRYGASVTTVHLNGQMFPLTTYLLDEDSWKMIVQKYGTIYSVQMVFKNSDLNTNVFESEMYTFIKPYSPKLTVQANQYGFAQQYYFKEMTTNHTVDEINFQTKRLRAGFFEGQWLVMSPRRAGAGVAYIHYIFDNPVSSIDFSIFSWSEDEKLSHLDSTHIFEYKNQDGTWQTEKNFDIPTLQSYLRDNPWQHYIKFPAGVTEFRFYTTSTAIGATKNAGRTCIGDLEIVMA